MKVTLNEFQNLWFTSDTHYNHSNIVRPITQWTDDSQCRNFKSLEEMNCRIVDNINSTVHQDDILIHLGDGSFGGFEQIEKFRSRINCKNIHLILGNHDHHIENNKDDCQLLFSSVHKYLELEVSKEKFVLFHFPIASWNELSKGSIHLHGHLHLPSSERISQGRMLDVGMDGNNYFPVSLNEVLSLMKIQPIKSLFPNDYHRFSEKYK